MSAIDHDRAAKFLADGSVRGLCGICGAESPADLSHGIRPLIDQSHGRLAARHILFRFGTLGRTLARHEGDDRLPLGATIGKFFDKKIQDGTVEVLPLGHGEMERLETYQRQTG